MLYIFTEFRVHNIDILNIYIYISYLAAFAFRLRQRFTINKYGKIFINSAYMNLVNLLPKRFRLSASPEVYNE